MGLRIDLHAMHRQCRARSLLNALLSVVIPLALFSHLLQQVVSQEEGTALETNGGHAANGEDELPRVEPKGEIRPSAEDPFDAQIFKDYPITGRITLNVDGEEMTNARPWQAYDGEMVVLYGFVNYDAIVELVNDTDFTPFYTNIDGEELGFLQFSIITYTSSNSGGYHELVLATPVTGFGVDSKYQEPRMEIANCTKDTVECLYYKYFIYKGMKFFVIKMWLNELLPVATGNELSGIEKAFAPSLDIKLEELDENRTKWFFEIADEDSDTYMSGSLVDIKPTEDPIMSFSYDLDRVMGQVGKPGMPDSVIGVIEAFAKHATDPYHQNFLVQPKGAYPPAFGTTVNPISMNNLGSGSASSFQDEYALRPCPDLQLEISGHLAKLEINKYPTDCYIIHNTQAVICPPSNIGPYTDMCDVTFPWKEYEKSLPLKESANVTG